ncbi:MAG TPA: dTDP-4-dehydrorhamnose reductase [Terriglobia bacterium]|nr:dTDP-4-dehydrorhamnose reductase [Terriglobia bacterium]
MGGKNQERRVQKLLREALHQPPRNAHPIVTALRIALTGSTGMLGRDLAPVLGARHHVIPVSRAEADVTEPARILDVLAASEPDAVIHAAAFTAVDDCERQPETAFRVNGEGTKNVASACKALEVPLMYVSTDYVFDGTKPTPYLEDDAPNPLNIYGKSKLEGERRITDLLDRFWIVRISWLFGPMGKNFVRTILGLARGGTPLRVVNDQIGAPTYTTDLSVKIEQILRDGPPGVYHVTNQGYCSWFEFAREALRQAGLERAAISPISTEEAGRPAQRPKNSRLANMRLANENLGLLPEWQDALARYLLRTKETATTLK